MSTKIDLTGRRFGRWIVAEEVGINKHGKALWRCHCDCGNIKIVIGGNLINKKTESCGCLRTILQTTHGMTGTSTYNIWRGMLQRCNDSKHSHYCYYGGRGIKVCKKWLKFENFYTDMGECLNDLTIERIDNNKGYYLENCEWATKTKQARNTRLNKNSKTGIPGVIWDRSRQKFSARITVNHKTVNLGRFTDLEQATVARKQAELKYWGRICG